MKVSGRQRRTIPAARPSVPASGQQLHAAQRVGAESRSQSREPPCRSGGAGLGWHLQTVFFFPLSLRLCADSHVGGLIKPHVLPDGPRAAPSQPAGGATASLMSRLARWGTRRQRTGVTGAAAEFPERCERFAGVASNFKTAATWNNSSLRRPRRPPQLSEARFCAGFRKQFRKIWDSVAQPYSPGSLPH